MKKLGLALGSGGARGIAHIGFLQALEDNDIKVSFVSGSSMGSVVGGCLAGGMKPQKMLETVRKLNIFHIIDLSFNLFNKGGIFRSKKYKTLIHSALPIKTYEHLKIPFSCVAVDLISGEVVNLNSGDLTENIAASSAMPSIFRPIKHGKMLLADGGIKCRVPTKYVREMGADVVVAVDVLGQENKTGDKLTTINVLLRAIDVADAELALFRKKVDKADLYIDVEMNGASQYKLSNVEEIYQAGYDAGMKNMNKIKKLLEE